MTEPFLAYLRADGIVLPPEDSPDQPSWSDSDSGVFSSTELASDSDDGEDDPSTGWREIHEAIRTTISELGGIVLPKLNWSAPKDATWISATNSMECRTPDDVYLLLKSSNFITHDLEYAFNDCVDDELCTTGATPLRTLADIPYCLVLRKHFQLNPSVEFRCFVRQRRLIAICQRDLNHFDFLFKIKDRLRDRIQTFFDEKLRETFPDENYAFDVYIPPPHQRVWLIDINPWAPRTDALLFSWTELLKRSDGDTTHPGCELDRKMGGDTGALPATESASKPEDQHSGPEFRLVGRDDPEAYVFNSPQYGAHKLPRDVVDAGQTSGGLREFAQHWKEILAREQQAGEDLAD